MAQAWAIGTECIGKYNFPGSAPHDLPFKKGEKLVIVAPSKDPNWYKARREDGLEGMIPFNYVQEKVSAGTPAPPPPQRPVQPSPPTADNDAAMNHVAKGAVQLKTMPWFHGRISREDAEKLLTPPKNGRFLVRESQNYPGDYTLCVSYDNRVENYRVRRNDKGLVTVDDDEYFDNLIKLVEHYQKEADGLCTRLKAPVDKEGQHLFVVDVNDFKEKGWAIPKASLLKKSLIGKGEFGEVWLGEYEGKKVAMKSMKDHLKDEKAKTQFLAEASVMTTLRHPNLVSLIGISLDDNPIYLITEFMAKGSLIDYLRSRGRAVITKQNQIDFARDVVKGMVYLESQNFVHRDLAARNVLIAEDNVAKVSDFGLAKSNVNVKQEGAKLPVKWTAPEALRENKFSNKTDVWSFGVLLWEIYSYGRVPYPRVPVEDVAAHVEKGYRMESPEGCPDQIYNVMKDCWNEDPSQRPNFTRIEKALESVAATMSSS